MILNLIMLFGAGLTVLLLGMTTVLGMTGNLKWTPTISRDTKRMYAAGTVLALLIALVWLGPAMLVSTWRFWAVVVLAAKLATVILDRYAMSPDEPRDIRHASGRRARIENGRYKPMRPQPPQR